MGQPSESFEFQAEVKQLLNLMVHSLYSDREVFLRELIANASDACDKLRFEALTQPDLMSGEEPLQIRLAYDKPAGTLTIEDNGIGMTAAEAKQHLGTIAHSGTKLFAEKLAASKNAAGASSGTNAGANAGTMIGQFGVGFYSSFMVADKVTVITRKAGNAEAVSWQSTGDGRFELGPAEKATHGTQITLHLKEDAKEFAEDARLRHLVKKFSDFVSYPVLLPKTKDQNDDESGASSPETSAAPDAAPTAFEQVNAGRPLWTQPREGITDEQYRAFYQATCKMWDEPASHLHFTVEGTLEFTALLFFPSTKPYDLFDRAQRGLNLYVRRVFVMDDCKDLLPEYLRFVRGVVDSSDLPLNVSREILQQQDTVRKLRRILVKRILDHLTKLADSEDAKEQKAFAVIDEQFGPILREGAISDGENRERIALLGRFHSSFTEAQAKTSDKTSDDGETATSNKTGFAAYIKRMPADQKAIYFITAPSVVAAAASPHVEGFLKRGYEVLYLTDPVDEWVTDRLPQVDGKPLVSVAKGAADLGDETEKKDIAEKAEAFAPFLKYAKEALGDGIKEVRLSARLTDSACCLVADKYGMTSQMEELLRKMGQAPPPQERVLELNPEHAVVKKLRALHAEKQDSDELRDHVRILRDQALLSEGAKLPDPANFVRRVQRLMEQALP
ncbi:MAG TPA: molecular chaperone HtpG [Polyangia bacterium]